MPVNYEDHYSDSVLVLRHKYGNDFFAVRLYTPDDFIKWTVALDRYTVPGRNDVYDFNWTPGRLGVGDRLGYFSDCDMSLPRALTILQRDLDRWQVIVLLVDACKKAPLGLCRDLVEHMLTTVAPSSKVLRACRRVLNRRIDGAYRNRCN
jgi:hypothetical protein